MLGALLALGMCVGNADPIDSAKSQKEFGCTFCVEFMRGIEELIETGHSEAEISQKLEDECQRLPNDLQELCVQSRLKHLSGIVEMIGKGVSFSELCEQLGHCHKNNRPEQFGSAADPGSVKSLYDRGEPTIYAKSRNELRFIGMPVGGVACGGVYLGGDGRLWLWDIFNANHQGIEPKRVPYRDRWVNCGHGACYVEPAEGVRPLEQGFAVRIDFDGKTVRKFFRAADWEEVLFQAGYPVGTVQYIDSSIPLEIELKAFSPFIPLNEEDSGLPATILAFSFKNKGSSKVRVYIDGWLENKICSDSGNGKQRHRNVVVSGKDGFLSVFENVTIEENVGNYGTMCIASLNGQSRAHASVEHDEFPEAFDANPVYEKEKCLHESLIGSVGTVLDLDVNETKNASFVITWYFPHSSVGVSDTGMYYENRFANALEVAEYVFKNFTLLSSQTLLWASTWKDSTLPHWFLERTFLTIDTLATTTCHRFKTGRFWAWEGVGACPGTCTHVWGYAQAMGRIFPALERDLRERTDLGIAFMEDGGIKSRAELSGGPAIDGQAGCILRCLREHQMSADDKFLKRNWDHIKRAVQFIINCDRDGDGMEDVPLGNTLDAVWHGNIAWLVGLCIAGVKAGMVMAEDAGDTEFAKKCEEFVAKGSSNMDRYLFNGEYYIHRPDKAKGRHGLGSYNTCHIDQVFGQSWAYQVGLGRILDNQKVKKALSSLWKYNFKADVGPYIDQHKGGRPYALAGEGGLIINTNALNEPRPYGDSASFQLGYFHECMTGFEHEVASHLIAEGMTDEGLTLEKAIHDRYHAAKRNPYNEIECSDHYSRAMASYGSFISACGFEYHGPKGYMRFAPKWGCDKFKAAWTGAEGWGSYSQTIEGSDMRCVLEPKYGKVELSSFSVESVNDNGVSEVKVHIGEKHIKVEFVQIERTVVLTFKKRIIVNTDEQLEMSIVFHS